MIYNTCRIVLTILLLAGVITIFSYGLRQSPGGETERLRAIAIGMALMHLPVALWAFPAKSVGDSCMRPLRWMGLVAIAASAWLLIVATSLLEAAATAPRLGSLAIGAGVLAVLLEMLLFLLYVKKQVNPRDELEHGRHDMG